MRCERLGSCLWWWVRILVPSTWCLKTPLRTPAKQPGGKEEGNQCQKTRTWTISTNSFSWMSSRGCRSLTTWPCVTSLLRCGSGGVLWGLIEVGAETFFANLPKHGHLNCQGLQIGLPPVLNFGTDEMKKRVARAPNCCLVFGPGRSWQPLKTARTAGNTVAPRRRIASWGWGPGDAAGNPKAKAKKAKRKGGKTIESEFDF